MLAQWQTDAAHKAFKNIRNRIGRLNRDQLIAQLIALLHHPDATNIERLKVYEVWHLLLLVKWTIMYGRSHDSPIAKTATDREIAELMNRLKKLSGYLRNIDDLGDLFLLGRNLAFQQLWLQRKEYIKFDVSRQFILFGSLDKNHEFQKRFRNVTGVSINDFLDLSWGLYSRTIEDKDWSVTEEYFMTIIPFYGEETIANFLRTLSLSIPDAEAWLKDRCKDKSEKYRSIEYEYFERSPFMRYPLLKMGQEYVIVSPDLLQHCLSQFIYDVLNEQDRAFFMNKFGRLFERLVSRSIRSVYDNALLERDLMRHLGHYANKKLVDFVIVEEEYNVFIETKGVAMRDDGMVTDRPGTIRARSKSSVLKAVEQGYSLVSRLKECSEIPRLDVQGRENVLIVVTYKDLLIGSGHLFREYIGRDAIEKIVAEYGGEELIPLGNTFIVSLDDFDTLLGSLYLGKRSLEQYMRAAADASTSVVDGTSFRRLVLEAGEPVTMLPYLENGFKNSNDRILERMRR